MATRGIPQAIRCDNGPELTSRHFLAWGLEWKIELRHIQPGRSAPVHEALFPSLRIPAEHALWLRMILGSELATQTYYHEPMSSRVPIARTALLVGFLASAPAFAPGEALS